jgi:hypothetical protein
MAQIKVNSVNTVHGNIEFEQTNPVISDFIQQQSREQPNYKYIVQIIPDYNSSAIKDDWRDYKECLCYEGAEKCVKEIVDDPRQHRAKRVRIVVEYIDSSLERYIKDHTDNKGNLKPKSVTLSPEHLGKTITCAGCKEAIHYGKPFAYYGQSAYCSKQCCVSYNWDGDNNRLFDVSPDKSLEEYDREFLRYYSHE